MPLKPDDTLLNGQYRILRLLGRGGFGFVYQAQDTLLHDEVAIKELIPALVGDEVTLKRFLAEARATMRLAHEHIVRTHNVFQEDGNYYIVMECMSGGSLEDRLRERGPLPVDEAARIAAEVCEGLDYAHQRGIVHCDLKPANILFASDGARSGLGSAKVADFGIAHVSEQMLSRSWMTPAGFVAGTLPYMSPEQLDGLRDDPRVDVYALGAVLYRMLTGRTYLEFDEQETPRAQVENVNRICEEQPEPPSTHGRLVPGWLDDAVLKALSKRPDERYSSAAEMQAALEAQGTVAPTPLPAPAEMAVAPARQRRAHRPTWFWPVVGSSGALLFVSLIAIVLLLAGGEGALEIPSPKPTEVAVATTTSTLTPTHTSLPPTSTPTPTDTTRPTSAPTRTAAPTPTDTRIPPTATRRPSTTPTRSSTPTPTRRPTRAPAADTATPAVVPPTSVPTAQSSVATLTMLNAEREPQGECIVTGRWDPSDAGIYDGKLEVYTSDGTFLSVVADSPTLPWAPNFMHFNVSHLQPGEYYAKITWVDPVHGFISEVPSGPFGATNIVQAVITETDCWSSYQ